MKMWRKVKFVLVTVIVSVLLISLYQIYMYVRDGQENELFYEDLLQTIEEETIAEINKGNHDLDDIQEKIFQTLVEVNDDAVGWITIKDSTIDFMVVKGTDNAYYLDHNPKKETSRRGSIFMDYRNNVDDANIIVYGHRMTDNSMFGGLGEFKDFEYYKTHSMIEFNLYGSLTKWQIYSVSFQDDTLIDTAFESESKQEEFINNSIEYSLYDTSVEVGVSDQILTLSTCSDKFQGARLIVHAKRIIEE